MNNIFIALFAYFISKYFGDFAFFKETKFKHPVVVIGEIAAYFENRFYQDSVLGGGMLVGFVLAITGTIVLVVDLFLAEFHTLLYILASSFVASIFLSHTEAQEKKNLNNDLIAPILYLLLFGLFGIVIYKTIDTLYSLVGLKNNRYEKYGKIVVLLHDILNFVPSRITTFLH